MIAADTKPAAARARVRLHPTVFAPRIARRMVHELGDSVDLPERVVDDAALVVGELVAESVRRSRRDVEVDIQVISQQIIVRVRDSQARAPLFGEQAEKAPSRGSVTVRHLATSWGCCRYKHGWEVWAVLRAPYAELKHFAPDTRRTDGPM